MNVTYHRPTLVEFLNNFDFDTLDMMDIERIYELIMSRRKGKK